MNGNGHIRIPAKIIVGVVLCAILFYLLGPRRTARTRELCMNNLRLIGMGLILYVNDHTLHLPPAWKGSPEVQSWWFDELRHYVPDDLWKCPAYRNAGMTHNHFSYAYNYKGLTDPVAGAGLHMKDIKEPSRCLFLTDSYVHHGEGNQAYCLVDKESTQYKPGRRHGNGTNVLYIDGHTAWQRHNTLPREEKEGEMLWNY